MTILETARRTRPVRTRADPKWHVGDVVEIDGTRWKFRAINRTTRKVVLSSTNKVNADIWWNTTLELLPKKAA